MTDFRPALGLHADRDLVRALVDGLDDDDRTIVLLSYSAQHLPIADLFGRLRPLGLLDERSTLSPLGRAVAKEIVRCDPEAMDPHPEEEPR